MAPSVEGDHVHLSNVISSLKRHGYDYIAMEYNYKGAQIHSHNPLIDKHVFCDPWMDKSVLEKPYSWLRDQQIERSRGYDTVIDFSHSLETAMIAAKDMEEYYWPKALKNQKYAHLCFYDQSMHWAGIWDDDGRSGEIYFSREEHEHVKNKIKQYKDNFKILWCLSGSMWQKAIYPWSKDVCDEFIRRHPETVIWTTGDQSCVQRQWNHEKVINIAGYWPFRQAALLSRYMNLVVTPETGLGICAGSYGTPKMMLLTAASKKNVVGNDKNDFSLQSDVWCSPCHRAIYDTEHCEVDPQNGLPICIKFDKNRILAQMEKVYSLRIPQNWDEPEMKYRDSRGLEVWQ